MKLKITDVVYKEPGVKECNSVGCNDYAETCNNNCSNYDDDYITGCEGLKRYYKKHPDQKPKVEVKYPCLMINEDDTLVVKFFKKGNGQTIFDSYCNSLCNIIEGWDMKQFKPIESYKIKAVEE